MMMARQTEVLQPHTAAAAARVASEMAGDTGAATAAMALQMYAQHHQRSRCTAQHGESCRGEVSTQAES
jgi:hypothetical protein